MTSLLNVILDYLQARMGKLVAYGVFGMLFGAAILCPFVVMGMYDWREAVKEVVFDGSWMMLAGVILILLKGDQDA